MSNFCICCESDEAYVANHLNWNVIDVYGHEIVANFTELDWLREAKECKATWSSSIGEPVLMSDKELAELLERVYGVT